MFRSLASLALAATCVALGSGCAAMVAGSGAWFENQKSDVEPKASADLSCSGKPITYKAVKDDYREIEASGCGKRAQYKYMKIGPVGSWSKSGEVTTM